MEILGKYYTEKNEGRHYSDKKCMKNAYPKNYEIDNLLCRIYSESINTYFNYIQIVILVTEHNLRQYL